MIIRFHYLLQTSHNNATVVSAHALPVQLPAGSVGSASSMPRLIVVLLLESAFAKVLLVCGIVCSTWVAINAGTSRRTILIPGGDETSVATRRGNIMCSRTWVIKCALCRTQKRQVLTE